MDLNLVSRRYFDTNGEDGVGIMLASVDIAMFSLDPDHMFV